VKHAGRFDMERKASGMLLAPFGRLDRSWSPGHISTPTSPAYQRRLLVVVPDDRMYPQEE